MMNEHTESHFPDLSKSSDFVLQSTLLLTAKGIISLIVPPNKLLISTLCPSGLFD